VSGHELRFPLLVLVVALLLSGCGNHNAQLQSGDGTGFVSADGTAFFIKPEKRTEPVELMFPTVAGDSFFNVGDYRGKVLFLNAWGPWCAPCRKEAPELQDIYSQLGNRGFVLAGVATRTDATSVNAFVRNFGITYPQLADYDSHVLSKLRGVPSATVPSTILIDRTGRIAGWALGAADPSLLKSYAEALLDETA